MSELVETTEAVPKVETLRVLFLGPVRLTLGVEAFELPYPCDGYQEALWAALLNAFPQLLPMRGAIRLVRRDAFLLPDERLQPGDEVALVPPVSGG